MILLSSFVLGSCEHNNTGLATLGGAAAGAIAGSQIGDGKGQLVATAIGTLGGAMLGNYIGQKMDSIDRMKANENFQNALETNRSGEFLEWSNPDTGNHGHIEPVKTYVKDEKNCRDFEQVTIIDGEKYVNNGTACRESGVWVMQ